MTTAQTSKTYHLIIGLEYINKKNYREKYEKDYSSEATSGVLIDIFKMERISQLNNHQAITIKNQEATVNNVKKQIISIGQQIKKNDTFLLYFSGHGDFVKDLNGDEQSGFDQVLVLYDDFLLDDEIYKLLLKYFTETKNIMIVDACHSSTSYKYIEYFIDLKTKGSYNNLDIQFNFNKENVDCIFETNVKIDEPFNLIYYGATEDKKTALGNINGGLLTYYLDVVLNNALYLGNWNSFNYDRLACEISKYMQNERQNLQYHVIGKTVNTYTNQIPFKTY